MPGTSEYILSAMPVKRFILATSVCLIAGAAVVFCAALIWITFIQPGFEKPSDMTIPKWIRHIAAFALIFCAIHFSAYLAPRGFRRRSAMISAFTITLLFFGVVFAYTAPFRSSLVIPVLRDFLPIGAGALTAWLLHP